MRFTISRRIRRAGALAAVAMILAAGATTVSGTPRASIGSEALQLKASDRSMIWNAVAVDQGRILVAGPRWTGSSGPSLGVIQAGQVQPYPDAAWNSWAPGRDVTRSFVNVNAIHRDREGTMWVVDTGSPMFGGDPLPGGAKLVRIDLNTNRVLRVYPLANEIALPGSYVDDIRINGRHAYLTDAGKQPGLIVLDVETGILRRVLDNHPSTVAPTDRHIVLSKSIIRQADGQPLRVNADPLELSPDGKWLYYGTLLGPWSKIETRYLDDASLSAAELAEHVEPWADLPPVGGTAMAGDGSLYFTELLTNSVKRRLPDGKIETLVIDPRLHWIDAPFLDDSDGLWLPVPQMDRSLVFRGADHARSWPMQLFRLDLSKAKAR
tara:strand:- start:484 stop:1623 length:1140 start_codon:yes stop_codon:yes gene_type:complete